MTFGHCTYCKRELLDPRRMAKRSKTRDHVFPKSAGGRKTVISCRHCNHLKGDLYPDQWARVMTDFPLWWKRFHTHGELRAAMAAARAEQFRLRRVYSFQPRWPAEIMLRPAKLCRGLAV